MFKSLVLIFTLFFQAKSVCADEDTKLLFVQVLFRHGDRAPITLYPTDPNPASFWVEGLGKLTMLGRKQHYALGKFFRLMYQNFITSSPLEVDVISSDCDRCIKSAETNLASFFAPDVKWRFEKDLDWQPFSVRYIPKEEDRYLEVESDCPRAFAEEVKIKKSAEGQKFLEDHQKMFENMSYYSGTTINDWRTTSDFYDVLFIEKKYNLTIPSWVSPYYDELKNVSDLSFYWSFNSPLLHRLRAGPLLQRIIENMNKKLSGELPEQKVQIYSAHDTNVAVVLDALNLFNFKAPPYCTSLLFELHETQKEEKVVRLLFLNSSNPETEMQVPHVLVLDGCTEFCPLDYFVNYTKHLIPDDWEKECQLQKSFIEQVQDKNMIAAISILVIIVILVIGVCTLWRMSRNRERYSYHPMPMS